MPNGPTGGRSRLAAGALVCVALLGMSIAFLAAGDGGFAIVGLVLMFAAAALFFLPIKKLGVSGPGVKVDAELEAVQDAKAETARKLTSAVGTKRVNYAASPADEVALPTSRDGADDPLIEAVRAAVDVGFHAGRAGLPAAPVPVWSGGGQTTIEWRDE